MRHAAYPVVQYASHIELLSDLHNGVECKKPVKARLRDIYRYD